MSDETQVIVREKCPHPELTMTMSVDTERVYWCSRCGKKIAIPLSTELTMSQNDLIEIIGIAFGETWKRNMEKQLG